MPAILYSYRRCPYAMRARMALHYSNIPVEIREISLRDKPQHMLQHSPKGTVPVLILDNGWVVDESLDIMHWALNNHDPEDWLNRAHPATAEQAMALIRQNDTSFKKSLDRYKYADRYPELSQATYRQQGEVFLHMLEDSLSAHGHLLGSDRSLADIAIFPFIRQFAGVDNAWFEQEAPYPALKTWLHGMQESVIFKAIMHKYPVWQQA